MQKNILKIVTKTSIKILFFLVFTTSYCYSQIPTSFEKIDSPYPNVDAGYFIVPEDWKNTEGKKIKIAVAILKNKTNKKDTNPIIMIAGGPGAGTTDGFEYWLNHSLRENSDIILMDARGTGGSEPRLCPDLGKEFLRILAKNQSAKKDEIDKVNAAMACKQQLIANNIDINAYHSDYIAKDLNALKTYLNYDKWNVYGASYGTYTAQVYANAFSEDIKSLILDSPISDISQYYTNNTSNYVNSLNKVFNACKNNPICNDEYPNLEYIYYETVEKLTKSPITVEVEKGIIDSSSFTYNVEDFKIAIHQALYQKKLIEIIPLLIYQVHDENKGALSTLVTAFSGSLNLDYGMYYCVSCNEALPNNSIIEYDEDVKIHKKLKEGLSFYKSDFEVCNKWNDQKLISHNELSSLFNSNIPVLIFSGEYDPITPSSNGTSLFSKLKNAYLIKAPSYGHGPSYSAEGVEFINKFVNTPENFPKTESFKLDKTMNFITDIHINSGITKFSNSINNFDLLFFSPLIVASITSFIAIFIYIISALRNVRGSKSNNWMKMMTASSSLLAVILIIGFIIAINDTASNNFYILAFGLPETYNFLLRLLFIFFGVLILSLVYLSINLNKINNRSIFCTVLFSNLLIGIYFYYWGVSS